MANTSPPKRAQAWNLRVALWDLATPGSYLANPTLASGDVKIDKDGGGLNNIDAGGTAIPSVSPAGSIWVNIALTATEMDADNVSIQIIDQSNPKLFADVAIGIQTTP